MKLPIYAYGHPILRKECEEIKEQDPLVKEIIENMFETMYGANGVGLAAPQVGMNLRLFIVDATRYAEDYKNSKNPEERKEYENLKDFKKVFINPVVVKERGEEWAFEEGCLSIPEIRADVNRQEEVTVEYFDENWELIEETYNGFAARVIQHEYDHIEGVLFTDKISPIKKRLIQRKLKNIAKGNIDAGYKMRFVK